MTTTFLATTLPNSNDGYVAAAYIVFFAIVLIYVVIMAIRLGRVERRVRELGSRARDPRAGVAETRRVETSSPASAPDAQPSQAQAETPTAHSQERETV